MRNLALPALLVTFVLAAGCLNAATPKKDDGPTETPWVVPALVKIDAKEGLANHAKFVRANPYRADNTPEHKAARDYLAKEFQNYNLTVLRHKFTQGIAQENICGFKLGVGAPEQWVIVGGHYDTTTWDAIALNANAPGRLVSQGAYDDGSGTWITMELARTFATKPSYYSILFCGFDGEERGLQGSKALKGAMDKSLLATNETNTTFMGLAYNGTHAVLDFDMFGICYPVRAPINMDTSDEVLAEWLETTRKNLSIPDDLWGASVTTNGGGSDYATWIGSHPTVYFSSDMGSLGVPSPVPQEVTPPTPAGYYPWWHWQDTVENMVVMAGSQAMLEAAFQTAFDLSTSTLAAMAWHPELNLTAYASESA